MATMRWDLFCRVVDNFGDIGVCWRLAAALGRRGQAVRLWLDDASALAWMAPGGASGVECLAWTDPPPNDQPGDVVVEAFGCDPPPAFVAAMATMAAQGRPPLWINLEYLSAEAYVERSHGLASPQSAASGPGAGLLKWFYYPGFTPATGGLVHDRAAPSCHPPGAAEALLRALGAAARPGEQRVSVFCYDNPALPGLLQRLARRGPTLLLASPGPSCRQLAALPLQAGVRQVELPWLSQTDHDRLLAGCDFNIVRGEDSFVRAQLTSDAPFLWQAYPQHDGAHAAKLAAFVDLYLAGAQPALAAAVRAAFGAFNGLQPWPDPGPEPGPGAAADDAWPELAEWAALQRRWRADCLGQDDQITRLMQFVAQKQ